MSDKYFAESEVSVDPRGIRQLDAIKVVAKRFPFLDNFALVGNHYHDRARLLQRHLAPRNVIVVEPRPDECDAARGAGIEHVVNTSSTQFPFAEHNVRGIGLIGRLSEWENDVEALTELASSLKNATRLYITVPAFSWLATRSDAPHETSKRYTISMLQEVAEAANLRWLFGSYLFSYSLPGQLARRYASPFVSTRTSQKQKQAQRNRAVVPLVNLVTRYENRRLARKSIPFGTHAVCVLEKLVGKRTQVSRTSIIS